MFEVLVLPEGATCTSESDRVDTDRIGVGLKTVMVDGAAAAKSFTTSKRVCYICLSAGRCGFVSAQADGTAGGRFEVGGFRGYHGKETRFNSRKFRVSFSTMRAGLRARCF